MRQNTSLSVSPSSFFFPIISATLSTISGTISTTRSAAPPGGGAAVHAADAAAKAAEVDLLEVRLGRGLGGKSFILLNGEVAAVQSSIKAAEALEETQGLMAQSAVIPSPHPDMLKAIG